MLAADLYVNTWTWWQIFDFSDFIRRLDVCVDHCSVVVLYFGKAR